MLTVKLTAEIEVEDQETDRRYLIESCVGCGHWLVRRSVAWGMTAGLGGSRVRAPYGPIDKRCRCPTPKGGESHRELARVEDGRELLIWDERR